MPVTRIEIEKREPLAGGQSFGESGPYEYLTGVLHFASDPRHPDNEVICDLNLAPTNAERARRAPRPVPSAEAGQARAARPRARRLDQPRQHDRGGDVQQRGAPHGRQPRRRSRQWIPVPPGLQRALDRRAVGSAGIARAHAGVVSGGARERASACVARTSCSGGPTSARRISCFRTRATSPIRRPTSTTRVRCSPCATTRTASRRSSRATAGVSPRQARKASNRAPIMSGSKAASNPARCTSSRTPPSARRSVGLAFLGVSRCRELPQARLGGGR